MAGSNGDTPPPGRDLVVVGASAGGVEALTALLRGLPGDLDASVVVVLHISPTGASVLGKILDRASALHCAPAADGEQLHRGRVYVAPPNCHVLVEEERLRLSSGPRENGHRPAVDPTMRSAADTHGSGVIGVILTGTRDDGTAGLAHVKRRGGIALVQDPDEAAYDAMPRSALEAVPVDAVLGLDDLARAITDLAAGRPLDAEAPEGTGLADADLDGPPQHTELVCPECGGALVERHHNGVRTFDCKVGHRYAPQSLMAEQAEAVEQAIWTATRSLEDRGVLLRRMARLSEEAGRLRSAEQFIARAEEADQHVRVLRDRLQSDALERDWPEDDPHA